MATLSSSFCLPMPMVIAAIFPVSGASNAATITASPSEVGLGVSVVDLTLDPETASAGAWLAILEGTGLSIDSIVVVTPGGTDCGGLISAASFDGQSASMPLNSAAVVAQVTIHATSVGGTLSLVSGNITDFNTFEDTAFTPGVLVTVVPEPGTALRFTGGLAGLASAGRRRDLA